MSFNPEQQQALATFLRSDLYRRAKEEVLSTKCEYAGVTAMPSDQATILLALEKGARLAFKHLENLIKDTPEAQKAPAPRVRVTHVTKTAKQENK